MALERHYVAKRKTMKLFGSPDTYDLARGLALGGQSSSSSLALAEQSGGRVFPFLDPTAFLVGEAFLFFPPPAGGEASFFSSSPFWEECASVSSDDESDSTGRRELFRVPVAFFSGTTWGAGTSNFAKRASAGSSGKGAGQSICPDFACQTCQR